MLPGLRQLAISRGMTQLNVSNDLLVIPDSPDDIKIGVESLFTTPLYWSLPDMFLGDKVLAYNGYLRYIEHHLEVNLELQSVLDHQIYPLEQRKEALLPRGPE